METFEFTQDEINLIVRALSKMEYSNIVGLASMKVMHKLFSRILPKAEARAIIN